MTTKHTPGPWESMKGVASTVAEVQADHDYITDANGLGVAELHDRDHDGERHANARLIAAAPDLLAACEALVGKLRSDETWGDHIKAGRLTMDIDEEAIDAALAAIAIVKGG